MSSVLYCTDTLTYYRTLIPLSSRDNWCHLMLPSWSVIELVGQSFSMRIVRRVRGGLEAERAERVKCKQEDMEREHRNFEAMQVSKHHPHWCNCQFAQAMAIARVHFSHQQAHQWSQKAFAASFHYHQTGYCVLRIHNSPNRIGLSTCEVSRTATRIVLCTCAISIQPLQASFVMR